MIWLGDLEAVSWDFGGLDGSPRGLLYICAKERETNVLEVDARAHRDALAGHELVQPRFVFKWR